MTDEPGAFAVLSEFTWQWASSGKNSPTETRCLPDPECGGVHGVELGDAEINGLFLVVHD